MRKILRNTFLLCLVITVFWACAAAEPIGFGLVNAGDVAVRKDAGGQKITRLQKGSTVWITEMKKDGKGELWYHVRAQEESAKGRVNRTGWIKAEFVDAGDSLWQDIKAVKAASYGMIALKTDGTVLCAGENIAAGSQDLYAALRDIRHIGTCTIGWSFFAVDGSGRLYHDALEVRTKNRIRLAGNTDLICITEDNRLQVNYEGNTRIEWVYPQNGGDALLPQVTAMTDSYGKYLFLTEDGKVYCANEDGYPTEDYYPEPDWGTWTDVVSLNASIIPCGTYEMGGHTLRKYVPAFAAVRKDGTVLAAPAELAALTAGWNNIRKVAIGTDWILGETQDGRVLAAGIEGAVPPDVSGWTDITDIANGRTYCVGIRENGTLLFAGEFQFDDSGS